MSARCSSPGVLKLWPSVAPWSPALSCVSSSTQEGPLALTGIDGETGGRLALDLLFLGQWPLARCPVPDALKLRSFMVHWSPALSCGEHIRVPLESCVSELFCPGGAMALSGIGFGGQEGQWCPVSMMDGEPGRRVVLGPHRPQASVLQPGAHPSSALKLRSSPARWSPALSCVSFSSQAGPLALTGIVSFSSHAGPLALTGIVSSSAQVGPMALSGIDGKPGGRVVLGPHRPQASVLQPGAHPPGVLKLRPSLAPWSPAELCELFLPCGPPGIDWHSELLHPAGPLALTGIGEWILLVSWVMSQAMWGHQGSAFGIRGFPQGTNLNSHQRGMGLQEGRFFGNWTQGGYLP
nr:uncharacterized protein LOC105499084 isoform X7 [Macaca nemestrina]